MRMSMSADVPASADAWVAGEAGGSGETCREAAGPLGSGGLSLDSETLSGLRKDYLERVATTTGDMLATLAGTARSDVVREAATQRLQKSLEGRAQALLESQLQQAASGLQAARQQTEEGSLVSRGAEPDLQPWIVQAAAEMARRVNVEVPRKQLTEALCITSNQWRRALSNASEQALASLHVQIDSDAGAEDGSRSGAEIRFDALVEQVRRRYHLAEAGSLASGAGAHSDLKAGQGAGRETGPSAKALRTAAAIEPEVRKLVGHLTPGLTDAMRRMGLDAKAHAAEGQEALREAAIILVDHGLNTPEQVRAFLDQVNRHDDRLAFLTGVLAQVGYPAGMAAFLWGIAPQLAPSLLGSAGGVPGALAFGALAGAMIGWTDSAAGSGASAVYRALAYGGSGASVSPLAQKLHLPESRDLRVRAGTSAAATFVKNALLRAVIPSVVYGAAFPDGVDRAFRDHVDFVGDAGGGFFSGGATALLTRRRLDSRPSRDFKVLTQDNLPDMIERSQQGDGWRRTMGTSVSAFGQGLGAGAVAPSTWAVTGLVMTPLVALLMGINLGLVPKLGWSEGLGATGAPSGNEGVPGTAVNGTTAAGSSTDMIAAAEHALKATVSTLLMAVLAGGATGVGNWVGRRADADCLAAVFGAVRTAAERLRAAVEPAKAGGDVALTGLRRRNATETEWARY